MVETEPASVLSQTPRRRWPSRLFTAVVIMGFLASCVWVFSYASDLVDCSPPSQDDLVIQRDFVDVTLVDAHDFDLEVMDCDDNGVGYVGFASHLSPTEARDIFVTEAGCHPYTDEGGYAAVRCTSSGVEVTVTFEPVEAGGTDGSLTFM